MTSNKETMLLSIKATINTFLLARQVRAKNASEAARIYI